MKDESLFDLWPSATDYLAYERTVCANLRTFLSFCRTAVALFASGIGVYKFIESVTLMYVGIFFMILAPIVFVLGLIGYLQGHRKMLQMVVRLETLKKLQNNKKE